MTTTEEDGSLLVSNRGAGAWEGTQEPPLRFELDQVYGDEPGSAEIGAAMANAESFRDFPKTARLNSADLFGPAGEFLGSLSLDEELRLGEVLASGVVSISGPSSDQKRNSSTTVSPSTSPYLPGSGRAPGATIPGPAWKGRGRCGICFLTYML